MSRSSDRVCDYVTLRMEYELRRGRENSQCALGRWTRLRGCEATTHSAGMLCGTASRAPVQRCKKTGFIMAPHRCVGPSER